MRKLFAFIFLLGWGATYTQAQTYASESVLKSGDWYQIAITESGMHRLDADFFRSMGLTPGSLDPRQIRIFGNGGGQLPQANNIERPDDLVENPIWVSGEADGSFDETDYVVFYAQGPHVWDYNAESERFQHRYNVYADTSYYYVNVGQANGKRISALASAPTSTFDATTFQGTHFHQIDRENPIKSGRHWLGENFDLNSNRSFGFYMPDASGTGIINFRTRLAARSDQTTRFLIDNNGLSMATVVIPGTTIGNTEAIHYWSKSATANLGGSAVDGQDSLIINFSYDKNGSSLSVGWLDWIEITYDQGTRYPGNGDWFFNLTDKQIGAGSIAHINLTSVPNGLNIWDISDPLAPRDILFTQLGNTLDFNVPAEGIKRFIAFESAGKQPTYMQKVANQNLHALPLVDYIIITHPDWKEAADRLAIFHQEVYDRSTAVVTPEQIFHEFSSGRADVAAIRDFIRMFWVRSSGVSPGFVNLFGDGSYIYKHINVALGPEENFIPTYQSRNSWDPTASYTSDDFFGIMEDTEGFWGESSGVDGDVSLQVNTIDIPIGRLPIENLEQANQIVDKIVNYVTDPERENAGAWRNRVVLVADHKEGEGSTHVRQADSYTNQIVAANPCVNIDKIYMDNYEMVTTAGVTRFPDGRQALLDALDEGSLIVNYTGHGGEQAWSNSRILENTDILKMKNVNRNPAVVTATCEFGRFDEPEFRTGAEIMTMESGIGAIALFTTVRLVYSSPNALLNKHFYENVFTFDEDKGRMPTLGEIMMRTKNKTFQRGSLANINSRNFTLLGDPGLILNYPKLRAQITHINGREVSAGQIDSLASLSKVTVSGTITDEFGTPQDTYLGDMDITVFDKPSRFTTRLSNFSFFWQKNRIFNGLSSVQDGAFDFEFIVPIDVSYEDGEGKVSLYFHNDTIDGSGCVSNLYVGGTDPNAVPDDEGPEVKLFINDTSWVSGGITDPNPFLYAIVRDENGINTVGSGIGHEISGTLDDDNANVIILNQYYTAKKDDYREGTVQYRLRDLEVGRHTLSIRVWDVANNASEASTEFIVSDNAVLALGEVLNYPNPFTEGTRFMVGHNQYGEDLELEINIYTLSGQLVHTLSSDFTATGNNYQALSWDGKTDHGRDITQGIYVYRVSLRHPATGQEKVVSKKMVVLK